MVCLSRRTGVAVVFGLLACVPVARWAWLREAPVKPALPMMQATSRQDLDEAAAAARARLAADEADAPAAIRLAEVLLRKTRVDANGAYAYEAEQALKTVLKHEPGEYTALKMLGAVYLNLHRFREAIDVANRAIAVNDADAWNYGVLGDAHLELGEREAAFDAFDTMVRLRPDAASYARAAYALELQGRLADALRLMRMAAEATSAHDVEGQAWHFAQVADLLLATGDVDGAIREYARADHAFPGHPDAQAGRAKVVAALRAAQAEKVSRSAASSVG